MQAPRFPVTEGSFSSRLGRRLAQWMRSRVPRAEALTLNRRIIYILPTGHGLLFLMAAALIFIAAINYAVSLAYGLAFLMFSIFILSILYSFNNLNRLSLRAGQAEPVFSGDPIAFPVELSRSPGRRYESLELRFAQEQASLVDLVDSDREQISVVISSRGRGWFTPPPLRVESQFPLGLCRAWALVDLQMRCLVYPKPIVTRLNRYDGGHISEDETPVVVSGTEDFYDIREYSAGDSLRQISWKNVARGQGLVVKEFVDYVDSQLWLDWDMLYGFSVEERLSRLCYCVLKFSQESTPFGLKLPGYELPPASGASQRQAALKALALFQPSAQERSTGEE